MAAHVPSFERASDTTFKYRLLMPSTVPNRVDPWGCIFATHECGYLMGNRDYGDSWIACSLRHPDGTIGPSPVGHFKLLLPERAVRIRYRPAFAFRSILASNAMRIASVSPAEWRP